MFTGLVEEVGTLLSVSGSGDYRKIDVQASVVTESIGRGDSIAVNGVCLTITGFSRRSFSAECLGETVSKTTLGRLPRGSRVNLERAVLPAQRLGGHIVQGHVDVLGVVLAVRRSGENGYATFRIPQEKNMLIVPEGSVAVNGVSLTVSSVSDREFTVNIIPETWNTTNLSSLKFRGSVNIETDILGRYAFKISEQAARGKMKEGLSRGKLVAWGYGEAPGFSKGAGV